MADRIFLKCTKEGASRLRVRIITPGFLLTANCQFPRDMRQDGRLYSVPLSDISLTSSSSGKFFYRIGKKNITIEDSNIEGSLLITKVYESSSECVICLCEESTHIFAPCGHYCVCEGCGKMVDKCPICRGNVIQLVHRDMVE
jgi:hypothetical protein